MSLFELNSRMAVKLNQSLDTLYNLEYMEYSMLINIVKKDIEEKNKKIEDFINKNNNIDNKNKFYVNLPNNLKIK